MLTVPEVAKKFGVSEATVLAWITRGELKAVNVSRSARSKRPRWRISQAALEAFEAARTPSPPAPTVRRSKQPADVIQFYV
ncbi:Helix-turn-helix domain protein [Gemmata sp. SH-PL17]|uniref:helix-turn-helix domain-containing protein n=1 Tax=Gemmata sp. SH-PL17 TaxID=1630693 RepID=UPI0004AF350A|nr:helix-turn-helix domain-containing protein [Gemmata sp. SH-PL17]AMV23763.1 Helix-turn-helix domain protein [Gemmata sp. SH-PL17]